jgi:hypothetical protein
MIFHHLHSQELEGAINMSFRTLLFTEMKIGKLKSKAIFKGIIWVFRGSVKWLMRWRTTSAW